MNSLMFYGIVIFPTPFIAYQAASYGELRENFVEY